MKKLVRITKYSTIIVVEIKQVIITCDTFSYNY